MPPRCHHRPSSVPAERCRVRKSGPKGSAWKDGPLGPVSLCHRVTVPGRTALILACENGSVEAAELLLSHGAAVTPRDRDGRDARHYARQGTASCRIPLHPAASHRVLLHPAASRCIPPHPTASPACDSEEEEEEKEEEEEEEGCSVEEWRCRCEAERAKALQLERQLATKTRECERLSAGIREQARELEQLLPGAGSTEPSAEPSRDVPEGECCLSLLAEHVRELRRRKEEEEERGRLRELEGLPENAPGALAASEQELRALLAPFLAWLWDACTGLREEKLSAFARSAALRKEVEEALRSKLHYEVVPADAVRKSLAAWEKLALGLERALSRADESGAELLRRSRPLLEILGAPRSQQAPEQPLPAPEPSQGNSTNPGWSGAGAPESDAEERSGELEKEVLELKESNGKLLGELARLGRERERLQEELRGLRERDAGTVAAEAPGRLRRRLAEQRRELTALRDDLSARAREEAGSQRSSACILQELHRKLDGLVRKQHEALQLVSQMEGEDEDAGGGDAVAGLQRELEAAGAEAAHWAEAAAAERRAKEELEARAARREREARELRAAAQELERSVEKLSAKAGELARTCQDKEGKIKQLLAETEKLSAEVLAVRSESARLQLRLERKNHRDVVAVYRTHLLNAAQVGAAHAVLLQILHTAEA
uniref:Ankyrin repeat domain-containing protein 35 n=1 Tax=Apteryx owenii TaxID=8824 RepID=A0A8B9QML0_APTOW